VGPSASTDMTFSWVTSDSDSTSSQVEIWNEDKSFSQIFSGDDGSSYDITSLTHVYYVSPIIHHVRVTNALNPDTLYYYHVGTEDQWSSDFTFTTAPVPGYLPSGSNGLVFGVIGDLGQTTDSQQTVAHLKMESDISMIIHAGDLSYADCEQDRWDSWSVMVENVSAIKPWMTCPGNHEIEADLDGNTFTAYQARFAMPEVKPAQQAPSPGEKYCCPSAFTGYYDYGSAFYSFDYGLAHVIFLNSYTSTLQGSAQYTWLAADLAAVDRSVTPWVFISFHCPWYNSYDDHQNEFQSIIMQQQMEPLFLENKVNAVFVGHVHAYERTYPIAYNQTDFENGVVYITIGDAGNREGLVNTFVDDPEWSAFRNGTEFGHGRVTVFNASVAQWEWRRDIDDEPITSDLAIWNNVAL
jgi:acid phosphatase type 7